MPEIKERPILFSAPMVRAILEGRKTVTRRALNAQALKNIGYGVQLGECHELPSEGPLHPNSTGYYTSFCSYGFPGDRLWVRETWAADAQVDAVAPRDLNQGEPITYPADGAVRQTGCAMITPGKSRPSIHMPRWASRILLEIADVRAERLQDISEEQAVAEGLIWQGQENGKVFYSHAESKYPPGAHQQFGISGVDAVSAFRNLWNSVGGDWDANPWVWAVEFKRVTP